MLSLFYHEYKNKGQSKKIYINNYINDENKIIFLNVYLFSIF